LASLITVPRHRQAVDRKRDLDPEPGDLRNVPVPERVKQAPVEADDELWARLDRPVRFG
jgi:hypothetical protein